MTLTRGNTIGIVGAGTFGTAFASVLAKAGKRVVLWCRDPAVVAEIEQTRRCPRLPEAPLPEPLIATTDPKFLAREARFLVLCVVSTDVRERAKELGEVLDGSHIVVHAIGALATPTNQRVSEVIAEGIPSLKIGAIAGPTLPADLVAGDFSSMVVASVFDEVVSEARRLLNTPPALRVYGSKDLIGVELASALSGAYTIALGLCDGLGVGPVARAVLVTRVIAEASRFGIAAGGEARTFAGLAGLGNLLVRATGERSREYILGKRLAEGILSGDAMTTEGARAAVAMHELAGKLHVRLPVLSGIAAILAGRIEPRQALRIVGDQVAAEE